MDLASHFPADFIWGAATAAYQFAGAWDEDFGIAVNMTPVEPASDEPEDVEAAEREDFRRNRFDFETQRRTIKTSGRWYRDLIRASR